MAALNTPAFSAPPPEQSLEILLIDTEQATRNLASVLRPAYRVVTSSSVSVAKGFLQRSHTDLVVTDLQLPDGSGADLCRNAKGLAAPPAVLVTTDTVELVPEALAAGCDGVLLKPFAPNLLCARVGRLWRARSRALRARAQHQSLKATHLLERSESLLAGTNQEWPSTHCPYCEHLGVTSFEFCSHRRAWYACLACTKVWIARRQEEAS